MKQTIRIGLDEVTYTAGMEVAVRMIAWEAMHAGQRVTWPDGTVNWYKEVGQQLWLHTRTPDGRESARQVR
jgi:hypothetical protein